ncbi:MAG: cytosine permease [Polyangiaceae bacterium]
MASLVRTFPPSCAPSSRAVGSASTPGSAVKPCKSSSKPCFRAGPRFSAHRPSVVTFRPCGSVSSSSGASTFSSCTAAWTCSAKWRTGPPRSCSSPRQLLVAWAIWRATASTTDGSSAARQVPDAASFWRVFVPSVTAMIGFWATLSLNMPDFTRFGRSQRSRWSAKSQPSDHDSLLHGRHRLSAAIEIYGEAMWDPVQLGSRFESRLLVAVSMFTVIVATVAVNIAANVVSPANDFANLAPKKISFKTGGLITGVVGILMMPWKLLADPAKYINKWLVGYSGGLGAIAGILIVDYWFIRKTKLDVDALYERRGLYAYGSTLGTNWVAIVATVVGCAAAWIGAFVPALHIMYDYAWFVGLFVSGAVYVLGMMVAYPEHARDPLKGASTSSAG